MKKNILFTLTMFGVIALIYGFQPTTPVNVNSPNETLKKLDSLVVTVNNVNYTIRLGDTAYLGYGSGVNDAFLYIFQEFKGMKTPLEITDAKKKAIVKRIMYFKNPEKTFLYVSVDKVWYEAHIPHVLEKKEILGFNQTRFFEEK